MAAQLGRLGRGRLLHLVAQQLEQRVEALGVSSGGRSGVQLDPVNSQRREPVSQSSSKRATTPLHPVGVLELVRLPPRDQGEHVRPELAPARRR